MKKYLHDKDTKYYIENICHQFPDLYTVCHQIPYEYIVQKQPTVEFFRPANLLIRDSITQVFSCEHCKIFKNTFFEKHLRTAVSDSLLYHFEI